MPKIVCVGSTGKHIFIGFSINNERIIGNGDDPGSKKTFIYLPSTFLWDCGRVVEKKKKFQAFRGFS
jgi:hypothetical protein